MKNLLNMCVVMLLIVSCGGTKTQNSIKSATTNEADNVVIANDSLEYEVIIFDPGFSTYLATTAYPRNYYSKDYLEGKNSFWIREYNLRARQGNSLYEVAVDYQFNTDYGYEVNYLLYNYLVYFQNKYNQKLGGYVPFR